MRIKFYFWGVNIFRATAYRIIELCNPSGLLLLHTFRMLFKKMAEFWKMKWLGMVHNILLHLKQRVKAYITHCWQGLCVIDSSTWIPLLTIKVLELSICDFYHMLFPSSGIYLENWEIGIKKFKKTKYWDLKWFIYNVKNLPTHPTLSNM